MVSLKLLVLVKLVESTENALSHGLVRLGALPKTVDRNLNLSREEESNVV